MIDYSYDGYDIIILNGLVLLGSSFLLFTGLPLGKTDDYFFSKNPYSTFKHYKAYLMGMKHPGEHQLEYFMLSDSCMFYFWE